MAKSRKPKKSAKRLKLPTVPLISVEDATDEGVMLAEYATRMALKNRIEVRVLAEGRAFDVAPVAAEARAELGRLAGQIRQSAERAAVDRDTAEYMVGWPAHEHDYRQADRANLERRSTAYEAVAARLDELQRDDKYIEGLVDLAREDAWAEVGSVIIDTLETESRIAASARRDEDAIAAARVQLEIDLQRLTD